MQLSGWGRTPRHETNVIAAATPSDAARLLAASQGWIARGNGRSYGDAAVGPGDTLLTRGLSRLISFDAESGRLTAEAGVLLADILETFVPRGFFPPVVPGTKLVTLGGMIAADVHGKNHHRDGGFGRHVERLRLALPDGAIAECSTTENAALFKATIGGMGLTGTILDASFRLSRIETGWMRHQTDVAGNLEAAMAALESANEAHYCVAWIDCLAGGAELGRSLIYRAEHASLADLIRMGQGRPPFPAARGTNVPVPVDFPGFALNRLSVKAFNGAYYWSGARAAGSETLVAWNPFFFPLDGVQDWNRIYGKRGFLQHQCVIPFAKSREVLSEILGRIAHAGNASFLAVLKSLGAGSGLLSFPIEGYTLALDFPMKSETLKLLSDIDTLVAEAGGRMYLAKDACQSRAVFEQGYAAALKDFRDLRAETGAALKIHSYQSKRLGL